MLRNTQFIGCGCAAVIRYWLWVVGLEQMARRNRRPGVEWMMAPALKAAGREKIFPTCHAALVQIQSPLPRADYSVIPWAVAW